MEGPGRLPHFTGSLFSEDPTIHPLPAPQHTLYFLSSFSLPPNVAQCDVCLQMVKSHAFPPLCALGRHLLPLFLQREVYSPHDGKSSAGLDSQHSPAAGLSQARHV